MCELWGRIFGLQSIWQLVHRLYNSFRDISIDRNVLRGISSQNVISAKVNVLNIGGD